MSNLPVLQLVNGVPMASSLEVAEHFEKEHHNVLKAIRYLICKLPPEFSAKHFQSGQYKDKRGRSLPMYYLDHDAFALLIMGFTGREPIPLKMVYLEILNRLERQVS